MMEVARRGRRRTSVTVKYTPAKPLRKQPQSVTADPSNETRQHNVDYELNKNKAIKCKLESTNRPHSVDVKVTSDNIVLTFSSAAYEEFKTVTSNYLHSQSVSVNTKQTTPKDIEAIEKSDLPYLCRMCEDQSNIQKQADESLNSTCSATNS